MGMGGRPTGMGLLLARPSLLYYPLYFQDDTLASGIGILPALATSALLSAPLAAKAQTAPPDNLRVTSSNGVATVRWEAVTGAGGYDIEHRRAGYGESWSTTCTASSGSTTSCATSGLRGDTMYEVRARATGGTWTGAVRFLAELERSFPNVDFTNQGAEHTEGHLNAIRSGSRDLPDNCTNNPLRKTWEMGRGCVIMKGATLDLHEQRLSTWLQRF